MKALSLKQPWAMLILAGMPVFQPVPNKDPGAAAGSTRVEFSGKVRLKDIENRKWPLPKSFEVPQRVYIHASKTFDKLALDWLLEKGFPAFPCLMLFSDRVPRGAIVGEVDITGCVTESESPWFFGPYGFLLANPVGYEKPIPYKGRLGFFEVELPRV